MVQVVKIVKYIPGSFFVCTDCMSYLICTPARAVIRTHDIQENLLIYTRYSSIFHEAYLVLIDVFPGNDKYGPPSGRKHTPRCNSEGNINWGLFFRTVVVCMSCCVDKKGLNLQQSGSVFSVPCHSILPWVCFTCDLSIVSGNLPSLYCCCTWYTS